MCTKTPFGTSPEKRHWSPVSAATDESQLFTLYCIESQGVAGATSGSNCGHRAMTHDCLGCKGSGVWNAGSKSWNVCYKGKERHTV